MKRFFQTFSTGMIARMLLVRLLAGVAFLFPTFVAHTQAPVGASVTVNANGSQGVIPASAFGINEAAWDGSLLDSALPGLLTAPGAKIMRYPGDSLSDGYNWQSNTTETSYANPNNTFDAFLHAAQQTGVQPRTPITMPTSTPTATPTTTTGVACSVHYTIANQWPGGFGTNVTITHTGSTSINGWTLTLSFANGQTIIQLWNGSSTQSGSAVTITNVSYNALIPAGQSLSSPPGFNGSWNGTNAPPTSFTLNGATCTTS